MWLTAIILKYEIWEAWDKGFFWEGYLARNWKGSGSDTTYLVRTPFNCSISMASVILTGPEATTPNLSQNGWGPSRCLQADTGQALPWQVSALSGLCYFSTSDVDVHILLCLFVSIFISVVMYMFSVFSLSLMVSLFLIFLVWGFLDLVILHQLSSSLYVQLHHFCELSGITLQLTEHEAGRWDCNFRSRLKNSIEIKIFDPDQKVWSRLWISRSSVQNDRD